MTIILRHRNAAFHRSLDFIEEEGLPIGAPAADAAKTELTTTTAAFDALAASQDHGFGTVNGAVRVRHVLRKELLSTLKDLALAARTMEDHPGLSGEIKVGRASDSYEALLTRARAIHTALVPVKDSFVALGYPATVDADLLEQITALEEATARKNSGRAGHIGGTAGLAVLSKKGLRALQKLDAIYSKAYKNDPVKLAAWKAARRIAAVSSAEKSSEAPATTPPATPAAPAGS